MSEVKVDREALKEVIDYLWYDEEKDYQEVSEAYPEGVKSHIFLSLEKLAKAMGPTYVLKHTPAPREICRGTWAQCAARLHKETSHSWQYSMDNLGYSIEEEL